MQRKRKPDGGRGEMFNHVDVLEVGMNGKVVGRLAYTPDNLCAFEYESEYLRDGVSISPFYLPLKPGVFIARRDPFNGQFGVFNDSVPDGWGLLITDRYLQRNGINPATLTPLDRLTIVGKDGMGALTYKPYFQVPQREEINDIATLAAEVKRVLAEDYTGSLEALINKGGSSGGARPKVILKIDNDEWLIKFPSSSDPQNIGQTEYEYSLAAKKSGIEMPETRLFENKYFGVRRFDRVGNRRIHAHSASGLLYASYRLPSLDYTELFKATSVLTRNIEEVGKLFRQMVFNVLTHNRDDHAKNFSFLLKNDTWCLSPAYDLVYSPGFNGFHTTTIAGSGNPTRKDIFEAAKIVGFPQKQASHILDEVQEGCADLEYYTFSCLTKKK
jgi:serine/threonine-protein kinase HipA